MSTEAKPQNTVPGGEVSLWSLQHQNACPTALSSVSRSIQLPNGSVSANKVDVFVYDAPLLRYYASEELLGQVEVLPHRFEPQNYAIALQENSPLREPLNRILLEKTAQPEWEELFFRYLGAP